MPKRLQQLATCLAKYDVVITKRTNHFAAEKPGRRVYPIAAHRGMKTEISDRLIKKICKHFGIDPDEVI